MTGGVVCALLLSTAMLGTFFFLALYLQQVLGFSAIANGLAFLPFAISVIFSAAMSSRLVTRVGFKPLLMGGFGLLVVALLWLAQINLDGNYVTDVLGSALIAGVGLGTLLVSSVTATTQDLSGEGELGLASGLVTSTNQVGGALGLAILSTVAFARVDSVSDVRGAGAESLFAGFQLAFYVAAGFCLLGLLVAALVTTRRRPDPQRSPADGAALTRGFRLTFYTRSGFTVAGIVVALLVTTRSGRQERKRLHDPG